MEGGGGGVDGGHSGEIKGAGCQGQSMGNANINWPLPRDSDECVGFQPWLKGKETRPLVEYRCVLGESEITARREEPGWG